MEIFTRITGIVPSEKSRITENKKSSSRHSSQNTQSAKKELENDNVQKI